jgi:predicted PurR-regulated permease PerM
MSQAALLDPRVRRLLLFAAALGGLLLVGFALRSVLVAVGLALLLAYLTSPIVDRLEGRGVSRTLTTLGVLVLAFGLLGALALGFLPVLQHQVIELVERLPALLARIQTDWLPWLEAQLGLRLPGTSVELLSEIVERARSLETAGPLRELLGQAFRSTASFALSLFQLALVPVLSFYAIRDAPELRRGLARLVPEEIRPQVLDGGNKVNRVVAAYLRGQLTVALILAALYGLVWGLIGVPSGVLVGVLAGLLAVIPYVGPAIGLALALLLTGLEYGVDAHLLWVLGSFAVVQGVEGSLITPRIVGESLGLHPVAVILGLVAGGELLGLVGMILALPALAALRVLVWPGPGPAAVSDGDVAN